MQRRTFIERLTFLAGSLTLPSPMRALMSSSAAKLTIESTKLATMPADFVGISFESPQLYNPNYFSPANTTLVDAVKKLSRNGILRAGGHLSDVSRWKGQSGDFSTPKQEAGIAQGKTYWEWKLTDPTVREAKDGSITPDSIRNLKGFLDATGWSLIYGLNFGCGSLERAADEAFTVSQIMGDKLVAFQIGNEDDQFSGNPAFRSHTFDFEAYFADYKAFVQAVRRAVPNAKFGGPDVATNMRWVTQFATAPDRDAIFLSSHFYAMGPAKDPSMTAKFLLDPNARLATQIGLVQQAVAAAKGVPYRMTEGNSCFGGGKPGVSDAYASSLWGADYLLQCASAGYIGVNLHGGGDGYYTPIAIGPRLSTELRPLYFGMQFASFFSGADFYGCHLPNSPAVTAYFGKRNKRQLLAVINKGEQAIEVELPGFLAGRMPAEQYRLSGPSLDATSGVSLAPERARQHESVTLAGYSALLLQWS
jgi:hypothetical protein